MTRSEAIAMIGAHAAEIKRLGVKDLSLFGSTARDEARADSDVDVLVEFSAAPTFDAYMDLKELLQRALGRRVDLVTVGALKPMIKPYVEKDLVRVA